MCRVKKTLSHLTPCFVPAGVHLIGNFGCNPFSTPAQLGSRRGVERGLASAVRAAGTVRLAGVLARMARVLEPGRVAALADEPVDDPSLKAVAVGRGHGVVSS